MIGQAKSKNRVQLGSLTQRQSYFVDNIIENEPIIIANAQRETSNKAIKKKSATKKHPHIKGLNENLSSSCGILTRRSYGAVGFNHEQIVQFNNRCSMKDNVITSDAILMNEKNREKNAEAQHKKLKETEERFSKQAVDLKKYYNHLKMEQITDAYYCANEETARAKQRQTQRQNVIQRVKSLSRSKSKEAGLVLRKKEQDKLRSIKYVEDLKDKYSHVVVPQLMGTHSSFKNTRNTFNTQFNIQQNFNSPTKASRLTQQKDLRASTLSQKSPIHQVKSIGKSKNTQKSSLQNSSIVEKSQQVQSVFSNSHLLQTDNLKSNTLLHTQKTIKESVSTNHSSLMKVLQKSKSTEDFIQKERVKVIKQAFILNWKQGEDKQNQKHQSIYPCKYTQNLKTQRQKLKQKQAIETTKLKYGQNALKKNPLEKPQNQSKGNKYIAGYASLKEYQMKFDQISKNQIKSCIVAKN